MSNIIKGNYIFYNQADKVVIDSDSKTDDFGALSFVKVLEEEHEEPTADLEPVFEEPAADEALSDEEVKAELEQMLLEANEEASQIIEAAKQEADAIREAAMEEGRKEGFESGILEGSKSLEEERENFETYKKAQEKEYQDRISELEPKFADLTIKLVEKMTGILAEDKKDLIVYLISEAMKQIRGPKQYMIRVSKEDSVIVNQKKQEILDLLADDCSLEIVEDPTLLKSQCFIETEDRILDVSLDSELKNLSDHFRMIACL